MEVPEVAKFDFVVADLETTGLKFWSDSAFALAISTPDGKDYCLDLRERMAVEWVQKELPKAKAIANHNLKFDLHFLWDLGFKYDGPIHDTMIYAALLDEHLLKYDLDYLGTKYVGVGKETSIYEELAKLFGGAPTKNAQAKNLHRAPWPMLSNYAVQDTRTTMALLQWQLPEIEKQELQRVAALEMDLLPVLLEMEHYGVRVDLDAAERAVHNITGQVALKQRLLNDLAGFTINPNPSGSIKQLFKPQYVGDEKTGHWVLCDGTIADKTEAGAASINADCLRRMKHPAAKMILDLRQLLKTRDTFLNGHILGHHHDGIIHANFNQTKSDNDLGTGTGRLSCNSPALQQIHKRNKEIASVVRAIFIPDYGQDWYCRDWSQMDFRVFAHYVNNPRINSLYASDPDLDFHQMVADMTGLPRSMTPDIKGNAKQINLGLVFGMGEGKLAQEMGLPYTTEMRRGKEILIPGEEALEVFEKYHENVPGIKGLLSKAGAKAKAVGFVKTVLGRRIRFPGGQFTHKAGGLIFQGSAADALKVKLVEIHRALKGTDARILLNVHDEVDTSMPKGAEGDRLNKVVGEIYECFDGERTPIKFRVPIRSSSGIGPNWWEASK